MVRRFFVFVKIQVKTGSGNIDYIRRSKRLYGKEYEGRRIIKLVVKALSREFEKEVKLETININEVKISLDNYEVALNRKQINKIKSPYRVDKFILEAFESQGFKFDINRSQYIQYCFGIY